MSAPQTTAAGLRPTTGLVLRRLLPLAIVLPLAVGALRLLGERAGLYSNEVGLAIMICSWIAGAVTLVVWTAVSLSRIDDDRRRAAEELRGSRDQYRALAGAFPDGAIVLFDRELRHVIADGAGLAAVGLSAEKMEGRTIHDVFPTEVGELIEQPYRAALEGEESTFEYEFADRTYSVRVVPVRDGQSGRITGGATVVLDVTRQKRDIAARVAANELVATFFENAPIGVAVVAPDGRWLRVNQALADLVGYTREELVEKTFQEITYPDDLESDLALVRRLYAGEFDTFRREKRYVHKSGRAVWIQLSVALVRDPAGTPLYTVSQIEGIDERQAAEEALRASQAQLAEAQKLAQLGSWEFRAAEDVVVWSDELYRIFGLDPGEVPLTYDTYLARLHPDDAALAEETIGRAADTGEPFVFEHRVLRPDGEERWVLGRGEVATEGEGLVMVGTAQDITERKRAEDERDRLQEAVLHAQKLEAVGQLAGGVAHEFNNLLMAIRGHAELLLDRLPPAGAEHADVQRVLDAAERATGLTRQLLAFGRKQILDSRHVDLGAAARATVELLRPLVESRISLSAALPPDLPAAIADPAQVEQVLVNLVLNARDAIDNSGTITLTAGVVELEAASVAGERVEPGVYVGITVTDSGSGMSDETRERMFEPFFTTKEVGDGSGLGLSTVYGIVRQGGGFVDVTSTPGRGTSVSAYFPAVQERRRVTSETARREVLAVPRPGRALVVDDEDAVRGVCAAMLESLGYEVETARDGQEALLLLGTGPFELVLTDVVMPGISGWELAERVRALAPETSVVCMSGYPGEEGRAPALEWVRLLPKPFTLSELRALLAERPARRVAG